MKKLNAALLGIFLLWAPASAQTHRQVQLDAKIYSTQVNSSQQFGVDARGIGQSPASPYSSGGVQSGYPGTTSSGSGQTGYGGVVVNPTGGSYPYQGTIQNPRSQPFRGTASYGNEQPVCPPSHEQPWSQNRRVQLYR